MFLVLSGCMAASEYIAGDSLKKEPAITYPVSLESVQIGKTTKEEVQNLFGYPTDIQVTSRNGISHEAWAYAAADPIIQPYQYVPLIGAYAFRDSPQRQSFSVNFSQEGFVDGISWRTVQAFGEESYDLIRIKPGSDIPSYGAKNPLGRKVGEFSDSSPEN